MEFKEVEYIPNYRIELSKERIILWDLILKKALILEKDLKST